MMPPEQSDHDLLVEIRRDVKYIREMQADHEARLRAIEHKDVNAAIDGLQSTVEEHITRITALEQNESRRRAVSSWKDVTLAKLIALVGATGGIGAVAGWLVGLFGGRS